jgi:hypothetical protein
MWLELALVGVLKVAEASLKVFERFGMRRGVLMGAVCGLSMSSLRRSANEGAAGGMAGIEGIGSSRSDIVSSVSSCKRLPNETYQA